jgi:organic radical activating enzyme
MQQNQQQPIGKDLSPGGTLDIHSSWKTIQGECLFTGWTAYFIRLFGCNLQCPLCDTDYTSQKSEISIEALADLAINSGMELVVLTGGEPFRQPIAPFIKKVMQKKAVQIETNGTMYRETHHDCRIVCSPKTPNIVDEMSDCVDAWKFVLAADSVDRHDGLPTSALGMAKPPARPSNSSPIYVQPLDSYDERENKLNMDAAVASCLKYGYRLCIQTHKIAGLD